MTVGSHNFVKFTVIKPNCQKHSGCVFASGKNAMYPFVNGVGWVGVPMQEQYLPYEVFELLHNSIKNILE